MLGTDHETDNKENERPVLQVVKIAAASSKPAEPVKVFRTTASDRGRIYSPAVLSIDAWQPMLPISTGIWTQGPAANTGRRVGEPVPLSKIPAHLEGGAFALAMTLCILLHNSMEGGWNLYDSCSCMFALSNSLQSNHFRRGRGSSATDTLHACNIPRETSLDRLHTS